MFTNRSGIPNGLTKAQNSSGSRANQSGYRLYEIALWEKGPPFLKEARWAGPG